MTMTSNPLSKGKDQSLARQSYRSLRTTDALESVLRLPTSPLAGTPTKRPKEVVTVTKFSLKDPAITSAQEEADPDPTVAAEFARITEKGGDATLVYHSLRCCCCCIS